MTNHAYDHNPWTHNHLAERGEDYITVMRDLAETIDNPTLHHHHEQELARITRPLNRMNTHDLNKVLDGIHDALTELLDELIHPTPTRPHPTQKPPDNTNEAPTDRTNRTQGHP